MPSASSHSPTIVEREAELAHLQELLDRALAGAGQLVVIEGPPGVGKTRLAHAVPPLATARGAEVLTAQASPIEQEFGFGIARQLFERRVRRLSAAARTTMLDGAAQLAEPVLTGVGEPPATIFPSLHGLYWLCVNLADHAPLVLLIDDAQWADEASMQWLDYLLRRIEDVRVLVVMTRRPVDPHAPTPMLDLVSSSADAAHLHPQPLSPAGVGLLAAELLGESVSDEFARTCHERTGGNPFLINEVLLSPSRIDDLADVVPSSVADRVASRLAQAGPDAQRLAAAVAVLDSDVQLRHAADLAELARTAASTALDRLGTAHLVAAEDRITFVHPLLGAAVYTAIPEGERGRLHGRAATLLASDGLSVERVAGHLLRAPAAADPWVTTTLREAADAALTRGARTPAIAYLERALIEPPEADSRPAVLMALGSALAREHPDRAVPHLSQAVSLSHDASERLLAAQALANAQMAQASVAEAAHMLEGELDVAAGRVDSELALRVEADLISMGLLVPSLFRHFAKRIDALPPMTGATPCERMLLGNVARCKMLLDGPWGDAVATASSAIAGGQLLRDHTPDTAGFTMPAMVYVIDGRVDELAEMLGWLHDDAARRGSLVGATLATFSTASMAYARGDLRSAEALEHDALALGEECGFRLGVMIIVPRLVLVLVERGKLDEAEALLTSYGMTGQVPDTVIFLRNVLFARSQLRIAQHRLAEGLEDLLEIGRREDAAGHHDEQLTWRSHAARVLGRLERRDEAIELATHELERARGRGVAFSEGAALRALGTLLAGDEGIALLELAVDCYARSPFRLEEAHTLADLGASLRRSNQRATAREPLRRALDLASRLGADPLAESVQAELIASGARPRRTTLTGVDALTASERRVAELVVRGYSNPQIAQALFVTRKTVEVHLSSAYRKLGITSRAGLATVFDADEAAAG